MRETRAFRKREKEDKAAASDVDYVTGGLERIVESMKEDVKHNREFAEREEDDFQVAMEKMRFVSPKNHIGTHVVLMFFAVCYIAFLISTKAEMSSFNFLGIMFIGVAHVVDAFLCHHDFFHKYRLLLTVKLLLPVSVICFGASYGFHSIVSLFCGVIYILYFLEFVECIEFTNSDQKEMAGIMIAAIFAIAYSLSCIFISGSVSLVEALLLIGLVCVALYSIICRIYAFLDRYVSYITKLNHRISELRSRNGELKEQSTKIKEAVDLLGVQKIELSNANDTIHKQNLNIKLQNEILGIISEHQNIKHVVNMIADNLEKREYVYHLGIYINKGRCGNGKILSFVRTENEKFVPVLESLASEFITTAEGMEESYFVRDLLTEEKEYLSLMQVKAYIFVPIITDAGVEGAVVAATMHRNAVTEDVIGFYVAVAKQLGIAIKNANMYVTMENLATRDGLTSLYNRRHFNKLFSDYVTEAMDKRLSIAVALFDIDKFKTVNDTYGHSFGDVVIVTISEIANRIVEENGGILGRYGGEEFVLAFLDQDVEGVMPIVQQIHKEIREAKLEHNGQPVHINVSIGVTDYPNTCSNPADLLNHADWAMYYSKQHGRGQITVDSREVQLESILE